MADEVAVGYVVMKPAGVPVPGASIRDRDGTEVAKTLANGAFMFQTELWPVRFRAEHEKFRTSKEISIPYYKDGLAHIELEKLQFEVGDPVEVIGYSNTASCLTFRGDDLWTLTPEWNGEATASVLQRIDLASGKFVPPVTRFVTGTPALGPFAQCNERIIAFSVYPGGIYELDPTTSQHRFLAHLITASGRTNNWPWACAFDGERLWLLERDGVLNHFELHALNLQTLQIDHSLPTTEPLRAVAWDATKGQFWISNDNGDVYAVNREKALAAGHLDSIREGSFRGSYTSLVCGAGFLWGVDPGRKQICKIKIRD